MRQSKLLRTLLTLCLVWAAVLFLTGTGRTVQAANDDPGAGRLSGQQISQDFYNTEGSNARSSVFSRFGAGRTYSPYTGKYYTHQSVFDNRILVNGIDVSQWQGNIDWTKVKAAGINYAFIRVGYRGYSAGTLSKDSYFDTNMRNATAAGVKVGVYVFSQAITTAEAVEEANYILSNIKGYNVSMPLVLDFEYASGSSDGGRLKKANLSQTAATYVCKAFCDRIASAGYTPMVYANKNMLENQVYAAYLTNCGYRTWLANYTTNTSYNGNFDFWQYSSEGSVNGISGKVDMNFYYAPKVSMQYTTTAAIANQTYTGRAITPAFTVTCNGTTLQPNIDYTIEYKNNIQPGMATITITGKGGYYGSKNLSFLILPGKMSGIRLSGRTKNTISLYWNKAEGTTGYQLYRSTALNGSYRAIGTTTTNTVTSCTDRGLTSGQCYYYKIRSYIRINGRVYWGDYSNVTAIYALPSYTRLALAKNRAQVYQSASYSGAKVVQLNYMDNLAIYYDTRDEKGNIWLYVAYTYKGRSYRGFVPGNHVYLANLGMIVNTRYMYVFQNTSVSTRRLAVVPYGKKLHVVGKTYYRGKLWYKVYIRYNGQHVIGWIPSDYMKVQ